MCMCVCVCVYVYVYVYTGMPNVGKSTLFNAFTNTQLAEAQNYPFTTIEPNVATVAIPDMRLEKLGRLADTEQVVRSQLSFTDVAGLVKGAHKGAGLGNQFLAICSLPMIPRSLNFYFRYTRNTNPIREIFEIAVLFFKWCIDTKLCYRIDYYHSDALCLNHT